MSITLLIDTGTLTYNGVTFVTLWKSHVSGVCEYDKAKRAVKFVRWTIEVEGFVTLNGSVRHGPAATPGSLPGTTDSILSVIRTALMQPGKGLTYTGKGFGPLKVNFVGPTSVWDVAWGPQPELLDFTPLGGPSAMVKWKVEFCIPQCPGAAFTKTLLAFNWGATIDLAEDRYASLTMAGELEIAQTYGQQDDVMSWRSLTTPVLPVGFTMGASNESFSDDKRTFTWSYRYNEMPPFGMPFGATDATGRYKVRSTGGTIYGSRWMCSLSATYNIRPDYPRREAWLRFLVLLTTRMRAARYSDVALIPTPNGQGSGGGSGGGGFWPDFWRGVASGGAGPVGGASLARPSPSSRAIQIQPLAPGNQPGAAENLDGWFQTCFRPSPNTPWSNIPNLKDYTSRQQPLPATGEKGSVIFTSFGFDEGLYKDAKTVSFDASWALFCTLNTLLAASGIWTKVRDCNKALWQMSMQGISGATAWQNLFLRTSDDVIIDACSGIAQREDSALKRSPSLSSPYLSNPTANIYDPDDQSRPELSVQFPGCPSPDQAWLNYGCWFELQLDPGTSLHKPLPGGTFAYDSLSTPASAGDAGAAVESVLGGTNLKSSSTQSDYAVRAATSTYKVTLKGFGVRAGYTIPVPGLVSFAGITPVPTKWQKVIGDKLVGNFNGIPIYFKYWELPYLIPVPPIGPTQLPPPNLAAHIGATTPVPSTIPVPQSLPQPNTLPVRETTLPTFIQAPRQASGLFSG